MQLGTVARLARYPVKSMLGEVLERAVVEHRGLAGDRSWALREPDGRLGSGKTSDRFRRVDGLLHLRAGYDGAVPVVTAADGTRYRGDDPDVHAALSARLGRPLTLTAETDRPHHDDGPVHLVTTASLRAASALVGREVDWRRTRANVVVAVPGDGWPEDAWVGRTVRLGDGVRLRVVAPMPRCAMVSAEQAGLARDAEVLRALTQHHDGMLGVLAEVVAPGTLAVGDGVELVAGGDAADTAMQG